MPITALMQFKKRRRSLGCGEKPEVMMVHSAELSFLYHFSAFIAQSYWDVYSKVSPRESSACVCRTAILAFLG